MPLGVGRHDLFRGYPLEDADHEPAQPLDDIGIFGTAEVVKDMYLRAFLGRVPVALLYTSVYTRPTQVFSLGARLSHPRAVAIGLAITRRDALPRGTSDAL